MAHTQLDKSKNIVCLQAWLVQELKQYYYSTRAPLLFSGVWTPL